MPWSGGPVSNWIGSMELSFSFETSEVQRPFNTRHNLQTKDKSEIVSAKLCIYAAGGADKNTHPP